MTTTAKRNIEAVYPLSPMQQGMLFHSLYAPDSGVYVEQLSCTLRGTLDAAAFERAWQRVVERHAVLRTAFAWRRTDRPLQVVRKQVALPIIHHDWRGQTAAEQQAALDALLDRERGQGFDISQAPLIRLHLVRSADETHRFVWTHHHLLMDGWSLPLLMKEVFALYDAFSRGEEPRLPPARPYRDYISWLQKQDLAAAEAFWRNALRGFGAPTPLTVDRPAGAAPGIVGYGQVDHRISAGVTARLLALARQHQLTLNTLVQGAWALLLHRYSGEDDIVFGATVAGRPAELPGVEEMIGLFINTLPVRVQVHEERPLLEWLKDLQAAQAEQRQFEYSPLFEIQRWSEAPRDQPLFESILVFENYPVDESLREQPSALRITDVRTVEQTNYPLTIAAGPGRELGLTISYQRARFDAGAIEHMAGHLATLLAGFADGIERPIAELPLLTAAERAQLAAWNDTAAPFPADRCVHQLFEEWAAKTPDAIAVTGWKVGRLQVDRLEGSPSPTCQPANPQLANPQPANLHPVTYRELNERANQLAHYLRKHGVGPETLVAICAEASPATIIAILAVLKAGGAYLPLDPSYPAERLRFMIADAAPPVLLTIADLRLQITDWLTSEDQSAIIDLEADWPEIAQEPATSPEPLATPDNLAYVIYTSGSTGRPKGVLIEHRGLVNFALAQSHDFGITAGSRVLQFAALSFDAAVAEIFTTLTAGATLYLASRETLTSAPDLTRLLQAQAISCVTLPPSLLALLDPEALPGLAVVASAGERCPPDLAARWRHGRRFLNAYGPTESTVGPSWHLVAEGEDLGATVPIGRPHANAQLYILDARRRPVPVGVAGELYIGGVGVARGYLNRPELTAEKFVDVGLPDSDQSQIPNPKSKIYKTGDLARYRPDGVIEYLGRLDDQVKLRGFRIELGEIEAALRQHPAVRDAVALLREDTPGNPRLVAYVVQEQRIENKEQRAPGPDGSRFPSASRFASLSNPGLPLDRRFPSLPRGANPGLSRDEGRQDEGGRAGSVLGSAELRAHLAERLPAYMVPAAFVALDAWPLTPSGKVDRKALPAPDGAPAAQGGYAAPRTPTEELLAGMWARVLGVARAGRADNFFELGGHSLLATQLLSRLRETFQVELPLRAIFEAPTLAGLAARIDAMRQESAGLAAPPIVPVARDPSAPSTGSGQAGSGQGLPLSFAQQRLWFLDQLEPGSPLYNNFTAVRLAGALDVAAVERSLTEIVRRHESLRTTFGSAGGRPVQIIQPAGQVAFTVPVIDLREIPEDELEAEVQRRAHEEAGTPIDLARGPLLRVTLLRLAAQEHVALLTMHHIVSDGWSMGVFIGELAGLYTAFTTGQAPALPALPIQYADFAAWQRAWLQGTVMEQQLAYWKDQLAAVPALLELPTDRPRPPVQTFAGTTRTFALPAELAAAVRGLAQAENNTPFITLLAAFQTLLFRYSGQERFGVGTPIANRTRAELEPLIGFFANTLVLAADLRDAPAFRTLLRRVRETALGAYAHQDLPFEMLVEALQPERSLAHSPLFQVMFVMNNTPVQTRALPDLLISPVEVESGLSRFDMTLEMQETPEGFFGSLEYNTGLFDAATIDRLIGHFTTLLGAALADPDQPVTTLPLLTADERRLLLHTWNQTDAPFPDQICVHQLIAQWATTQPDHPAATFAGGATLSYAQLDARANQLAHALQRRGVGPDSLVAIALPRSLDLVIAILATLKAGGAFLPLDLSYPPERLRFMIEDARPTALLTIADAMTEQSALSHPSTMLRTGLQSAIISLDAAGPEIAREPATMPESGVTPEHLAYVIYTSGSTGQPKGALLAHRGLANLAAWQRRAFGITPASRVLQFAALSFDAAVWEYVMALVNGATLVLAPPEQLADGQALLRLLQQQRVTIATLPPSLLAVLEPAALPDLATVVAAGEACSAALVQTWGPGRTFVNAYGPTETTVCASAAVCDPAADRPPPIGGPIANTRVYVLDAHRQPVPIGVPGELYIGGVGVARGYLNRPELTAEKFVDVGLPDSDQSQIPNPRSKIYKTGDLVRWRVDGQLEFLGRLDHQVKLRGFRIELGEIEAALRGYPGVADALALVRETGSGPRLVGYVVPVPEPRTDLSSVELRAHLAARLPEYMVPAAFVALERWPLTPSGKVDRGALPLPDHAEVVRAAYVALRTETEAQLAELAAELLGLARVGVDDSFFELGGHSLLATQLISRVREQCGVEVPLRALFEHPTIAALAEQVDSLRAAQQAESAQVAELLAQISSLSDDEVRALLMAKEGA